MKSRQILILLLVVGFLLGSLGVVAVAQEERQRRERERGQRRFSTEEIADRYVTRLKEELGATSEEWQVLQPKLKALTLARFELRRLITAEFGGMRGFLGRRRFGQSQEEVEATPEGQLMKLLQDESVDADAIRAKLAEVRAAREKERKENEKKIQQLRAQIAKQETELKGLLTIRQEALLVLRGILS